MKRITMLTSVATRTACLQSGHTHDLDDAAAAELLRAGHAREAFDDEDPDVVIIPKFGKPRRATGERARPAVTADRAAPLVTGDRSAPQAVAIAPAVVTAPAATAPAVAKPAAPLPAK